MINGVECGREIKKNESSNFTVVDGGNDVIVDLQKSGFSGMKWAIRWLEGKEERIGWQMRIYSTGDYLFKNFGYEIQIWDRAIVIQIFRREWGLFQQRAHMGILEDNVSRDFLYQMSNIHM